MDSQPEHVSAEAESDRLLDQEHLLEQVDHDYDLLNELLDLFRKSCVENMREAREAIARSDAGALARAAHAVKGAAGNLSGMDAHDAAERLERVGRAGDLGEAAAGLAALEQAVEELESALERLLESGRG